jgi:hypothetical protein
LLLVVFVHADFRLAALGDAGVVHAFGVEAPAMSPLVSMATILEPVSLRLGHRRVYRGVLLNDREGGDADAVGLEGDDAADGEIHLGQLLAPWARPTPRRFAMRIDF